MSRPWPPTQIAPIDLVVVNLYPFEATVAKPNVSLHDAIENIDIGGPSMLRSAAKNHDSVTVVVDPFDYAEVAKQISSRRQHLAWNCAANWPPRSSPARRPTTRPSPPTCKRNSPPSKNSLPLVLTVAAPLAQPLRYGENPHQTAALYGKFHDFFQAVARQGAFLQ